MTLYQLNVLDEQSRYQVLWDQGVHIAERVTTEYTLILYQIDGFYVEVKYNQKTNKIEGLRSFGSINRLEPYLGSIEINNLL